MIKNYKKKSSGIQFTTLSLIQSLDLALMSQSSIYAQGKKMERGWAPG